jgi:GNAT superfamily N-acetyltransferase
MMVFLILSARTHLALSWPLAYRLHHHCRDGELIPESVEGAMTATYRQATPADISHIVQFQINMARETEDLALDSQVLMRGVRAVFEDPSRGQYYVAEREGRILASTLVTYEWSDWRNGLVWWIQSVYVVPEARRQGVYAGLYSYIKGLAEADERVQGIRLYVDRRNTRAQQVYARLGMNGEHYQVFEWMKSF